MIKIKIYFFIFIIINVLFISGCSNDIIFIPLKTNSSNNFTYSDYFNQGLNTTSTPTFYGAWFDADIEMDNNDINHIGMVQANDNITAPKYCIGTLCVTGWNISPTPVNCSSGQFYNGTNAGNFVCGTPTSSSGGSGNVTGLGTAYYIPMFTNSTHINKSPIYVIDTLNEVGMIINESSKTVRFAYDIERNGVVLNSPYHETNFEEMGYAPASYTVISTAVTVNSADINIPTSVNAPTTTTNVSDSGIRFAGTTNTATRLFNITNLYEYRVRAKLTVATDYQNHTLILGAFYSATTINMLTNMDGIFWCYKGSSNSASAQNWTICVCNTTLLTACETYQTGIPADLNWHDFGIIGNNKTGTQSAFTFYYANLSNVTVYTNTISITNKSTMPLMSTLGTWGQNAQAVAKTHRIDWFYYDFVRRYGETYATP